MKLCFSVLTFSVAAILFLCTSALADGKNVLVDADTEGDDKAGFVSAIQEIGSTGRMMVLVSGKDVLAKSENLKKRFKTLGIEDRVQIVVGSRILVSDNGMKALRNEPLPPEVKVQLGTKATDMAMKGQHAERVGDGDPDRPSNGKDVQYVPMSDKNAKIVAQFIKDNKPTYYSSGPKDAVAKTMNTLKEMIGTEPLSRYIPNFISMGGGNVAPNGGTSLSSQQENSVRMIRTFNAGMYVDADREVKKICYENKLDCREVSTDRVSGFGALLRRTPDSIKKESDEKIKKAKNEVKKIGKELDDETIREIERSAKTPTIEEYFLTCLEDMALGKTHSEIPGCEVDGKKSEFLTDIHNDIRSWSTHMAHTIAPNTVTAIPTLRKKVQKLALETAFLKTRGKQTSNIEELENQLKEAEEELASAEAFAPKAKFILAAHERTDGLQTTYADPLTYAILGCKEFEVEKEMKEENRKKNWVPVVEEELVSSPNDLNTKEKSYSQQKEMTYRPVGWESQHHLLYFKGDPPSTKEKFNTCMIRGLNNIKRLEREAELKNASALSHVNSTKECEPALVPPVLRQGKELRSHIDAIIAKFEAQKSKMEDQKTNNSKRRKWQEIRPGVWEKTEVRYR